FQHCLEDGLGASTNCLMADGCSPGVQDPTSYPVLLLAVSSTGRPTSPLSEVDYEAARALDTYSERMGLGV
ncbi:hypothetical protein A2U01_0055017, partial [Trifolium medium]|nr:hypothetical protein [Trifolium medium]